MRGMIWGTEVPRRDWTSREILVGLLLLGLVLAGCGPAPSPTLPPATLMGSVPPTPTLPPATPMGPIPPSTTATEASLPTPPANPSTSDTLQGRKGLQLTILHTNDTTGEIDPCG